MALRDVNTLDVWWRQRLSNLTKACTLLAEIQTFDAARTPAIIREGFIKRFEVAFDLAWKTLKDYLEYQGLKFQPSPRAIIKEAFSAGLIEDGHLFIDMLEKRNTLSHSYDEAFFTQTFLTIKELYQPALAQLDTYLKGLS